MRKLRCDGFSAFSVQDLLVFLSFCVNVKHPALELKLTLNTASWFLFCDERIFEIPRGRLPSRNQCYIRASAAGASEDGEV